MQTDVKVIERRFVKGLEAPVFFDGDRRLEEGSDEYAITAIIGMLATEGRKRNVRGTISILDTEAMEFLQDVQDRTEARLPNQGLGMSREDTLSIVNEEMDAAIGRFWSRPHSVAE